MDKSGTHKELLRRYYLRNGFADVRVISAEAVLNEKFIDDSTSYYQNELTNTEVEDMEGGLVGEFSQQDMANLLHDVSSADHENFKALRYPDRVGTNYPKGDALSCYKILPKKQ